MSPARWETLKAEAAEIVEAAIAELPPDIQAEALRVPCRFEPENDEDPDLLGIYCDFAPGEISASNGPIILYLAAIENFCDDEDADFAAEVRLTYLHELGHHLGWDEGDLEARGLE